MRGSDYSKFVTVDEFRKIQDVGPINFNTFYQEVDMLLLDEAWIIEFNKRSVWRIREGDSVNHLFRLPFSFDPASDSSVCGLVNDMDIRTWLVPVGEPPLEERCQMCQRWWLMDELAQ